MPASAPIARYNPTNHAVALPGGEPAVVDWYPAADLEAADRQITAHGWRRTSDWRDMDLAGKGRVEADLEPGRPADPDADRPITAADGIGLVAIERAEARALIAERLTAAGGAVRWGTVSDVDAEAMLRDVMAATPEVAPTHRRAALMELLAARAAGYEVWIVDPKRGGQSAAWLAEGDPE